MHPTHMLRAMVEDRRRQVIFEAGAFRRGGQAGSGGLVDRIVRLARQVASFRPVRAGRPVAGSVPAVGPRT